MNIRDKGFTLLELMVVVVIIAIMAAVLVPLMGDNGNRRVADAAGRLVMLTNLAQQEAILSFSVVQLVFDVEQGVYRYQQLDGVDFADLTAGPLAGVHQLGVVTLDSLEVNGRLAGSDSAGVYLYPTGEQEPFRAILASGTDRYLVAMDPVGEAWMEAL